MTQHPHIKRTSILKDTSVTYSDGSDHGLSMSAGSRAREWARGNTVWRTIEDGRICIRPEDLMQIVDRLEAADTLLAECRRYVTAMEDAAAESLGIYDHSKRSKSGIEKRLDYYFENTEKADTAKD